ncbi:1-acyl-sn-glycerol-3-phosphate acyltransferase [bacterium]|nr:MAG: 1-acyl-sn-glycerol-3-phosphate acyltransferase [bacterium]
MPDRFPPIYRLATGFFRRLYFPTHGGVEVRHAERVPLEGGLIVVSNHMSHLDAPAMAATLKGRRLRAMAKEELWNNRFFGWLIKEIGAFPVKRGEADAEGVRKCLELLKGGEAVIVFAEGTRSDGKTMLPLEPGVALLAKKSGVPVLPVGICGTQFMMPQGGGGRKERVRVVVGEPFTFDEVAGKGRDGRERFLAELGSRVLALTAEGGIPLEAPSKADGVADGAE